MARLIRVVDERVSSVLIEDEAHTIGEDGTANFIFLDEAPDPEESVTISGFTEVSGTPAADEYRVYYTSRLRSAVEFHSSDNGQAITVDYHGQGSAMKSRDVNPLMDRVEGDLLVLTDAATIAWDMAEGTDAIVTLGGDRTLGAPTNVRAGMSGNLFVVQPSSGGPRLLAYHANWKSPGGTDPVASTAANAVDVISYVAKSSTEIAFTMSKDHK
jgi:hypothetical protein